MKTKKTFLLRAAAAFFAAGLSQTFIAWVSEKTGPAPRSGQQMKRKKAGFYADNGSRGGEVIQLVRLIAYSPVLPAGKYRPIRVGSYADRGGKVIVSEATAQFAPKHKNVMAYPADRFLTDAVFATARK